MSQATSSGVDRAAEDADVLAFRLAPTPVDADARLRALLVSRVRPVVERFVSRRMRDARDRQAAEDLCHDVLLQLVAKLQQLRADPGAEPIVDLDAYAAVTAQRACNAYLRLKFPERSRLKNRLRYVLTRDERFRFAERERDVWTCALSEWPAEAPMSGAERVNALRMAGGAPARFLSHGANPAEMPLHDLVSSVLTYVGAPTALDDLVSVMATIIGVDDHAPEPSADPEHDDGRWWEALADTTRSIPERLDDRAFLADVWAELGELPVRQRVALLLNLRDADGREMTSLFPLIGVATQGDIARVLEMTPSEITGFWPRLPMDDLSIASLLGVTRQQVINLRKSGRDRLARRLRRWRT